MYAGRYSTVLNSTLERIIRTVFQCKQDSTEVNRVAASLIWMAAVGVEGANREVELIAHRGASYNAPENTMAAIELAWSQDFDVEIDIHLTLDGRLVAVHDSDTRRTAGRRLVVARSTAGELRELDVGRWMSDEFAGERIPLLEEVLETIPPQRRLFIEVKSGNETVPVLERVVGSSGKAGQVVIISFSLETVVLAKESMPQVPVYLLMRSGRERITRRFKPHDASFIELVREHGLDGLNVHFGGVTAGFVGAAKAFGLNLYVWTVDDTEEARRLVELKVDGITTNRPKWLMEQMAAGKEV